MSDLKFMLNSQMEFQLLKNNNLASVKFIRHAIEDIYIELSNILNEIPREEWKTNQKFDIHSFRNNLINIQLFLMDLFLSANMDSDMIFRMFREKIIMNIEGTKT